jgi:hypothetical protein
MNPQMMTMQCDICLLPFSGTNLEKVLLAGGWQLRSHGAEWDVCPVCGLEWGRPTPRLEVVSKLDPTAGRLPNLIIIGAAKAGTTSFHNYLDTHPEIAMSELKELRYFIDPEYVDRLGWYRSQFDTSAKIAGESSTMYTRSPAMPGTAERMADLVPDTKLIYLVRDPIDRAIASYLEERFHGLDPRSVEEAFADLDDPYNPYLAASRYAEQLSPYLEHFGRDQLLILSLTDLERDPGAVLEQTFRFLGVDPTHRVDTGERHNAGAAKWEYGKFSGRLRRSFVGKIVHNLPPGARTAIRMRARRLLSKPVERPELSPELRERIADVLAPDAKEFRRLTGMDFAEWSV